MSFLSSMDYSPSFMDTHIYQSDQYASPMSLPPSATPRSVASRDEAHINPLIDSRFPRRLSTISKKSIGDMGPASAVTSYHPNSVAPSTPSSSVAATPRTVDTTRIQPSLQNIVSTVSLGCQLDLKRIALQARNAEYNPKRFAAVIMRIRSPRTTALIFTSGKMVCTGAKSEEDSIQAARRYARVIQKLGFPAKFLDFKIQNMVGSADVNFKIRLEALALKHDRYCSYEPELFPGLIYRVMQPKIVLLIFNSGKVVLTGKMQEYIDLAFMNKIVYRDLGAKERRQIYEAFELIFPILKTFRRAS